MAGVNDPTEMAVHKTGRAHTLTLEHSTHTRARIPYPCDLSIGRCSIQNVTCTRITLL